MSPENTIDHSAFERRWEHAINSGRVQLGNLSLNIDFLEKTAQIEAGKKVLELGCGAGNLASWLKTKDVHVIASDISQTAVEHARQLHPDIEFRVHPAQDLPYEDHTFDIVMSFDVLEHLPDVDQHLSEVRRVLKPGGSYLLQTPNKLTNSVFETLHCRSMAWKKYHPSLHSYGQLRRRLNRHGFSFHCIKMNTMSEFMLKKIKKVGLPPCLFAWINFRYFPYRLQTNFFVIARKKD